MPPSSFRIATRGSPLALAQANVVAAAIRAAFPRLDVQLRIIRTTGDKLQRASLAKPDASLPKGLFTKELEVALLEQEADLAVHSLKDLPTDLPAGLMLRAVLERADARDVLVYRSRSLAAGSPSASGSAGTDAVPDHAPTAARRGFPPHLRVADLPQGAVIASSSTRRREQLLALRPDLQVIEIRGNVGTRLRKLADSARFDGTLLAAAGLLRLGFRLEADGRLLFPSADVPAGGARVPPSHAFGAGSLAPPQPRPARLVGPALSQEDQGPSHDLVSTSASSAVPAGLLAVVLPVSEMVPCVGQAAIGIEVREADERASAVCARLNHEATFHCVAAERAFLRALGGGCQSPVAAIGEIQDGSLRLRGVSFRSGSARRGEVIGLPTEATRLGEALAARIAGESSHQADRRASRP